MCAKRTSRARSPLRSGSSGVLDAPWCNLSLILGAFLSNKFIYLFLLLIYYLFFYPTQLEREKIKLEREILENSPQSGRSPAQSVRVGVSAGNRASAYVVPCDQVTHTADGLTDITEILNGTHICTTVC